MAQVLQAILKDNTIGALLIGTYIAVALYGLISHQIYRYYRMYPQDPSLLKLTVGAMWTLETLHSILCMHTCYFFLVANYLNPERLISGVWSLRLTMTLTGMITTISHIFFSRRVHLLLHKSCVTAIIMTISIARLGFAIASTVTSFNAVTFPAFQKFIWIICITLGLAIASDLIITITLGLFLSKSKTGFERTDSILDKLLLYAINIGILTIVFDAVVLICAATMKDNLVYIGLYFAKSKLYTNSLLAVLNSRESVKREDNPGSFILQQIVFEPETGDHSALRHRNAGAMNMDDQSNDFLDLTEYDRKSDVRARSDLSESGTISKNDRL